MNANSIQMIQGWPGNVDALAAFLDSNWDHDSMSPELLKEKLFDDPNADPELCITALDGDKIVGFLFCVQRHIRGTDFGYIKLMAVEKSYRRMKMGSRMYQMAEETMRAKGATCIRWYDVPLNYLMPGIDPRYTEAICFAQKHGFKQFGEAVNMLVELNESDWSTEAEEQALIQKGVEVRRATPNDMPAIIELLKTEWELWENEVRMAMKDNPPSVHIAFIYNKLRAFSVHNGNNKGTGWFGPMGTHPDMRGLGMGNILLKRCLKDMKQQGHAQAVIPWVAPIAFYSHYVNARINRVFWRMEKHL